MPRTEKVVNTYTLGPIPKGSVVIDIHLMVGDEKYPWPWWPDIETKRKQEPNP